MKILSLPRLRLEMVVMVIFLAVVVGLLSLGTYYALQFDWVLRLRHITTMSCQDIPNSHVITLIVLGITFGFLVILAIGEAIQWLDAKDRKRKYPLALVIMHCTAALAVGIIGSWVLRVMC